MTKQSRGGRGGRGGNRGRGRGGSRGGSRGAGIPSKKREENVESVLSAVPADLSSETKGPANVDAEREEVEEAVCWICAEPVKYYSVSACNHRTCHVCALRLRALYKKRDCTFCKVPQPTVIFTVSEDRPFSEYKTDDMIYKDERLSIVFETQEMMEETLILLRFNCPDTECDYIAKGWSDLKLHVRAHHNKLMCDLCIRMKKVFAHELPLYTYAQLIVHLPSMNRRSNQKQSKEEVEGGVHPLCEFCRECFFSGDELYSHMRERHEECFICKRNDVRDQYFKDYASLENHFNTAHHPCTNTACLAQKFVVFNTPLDLQAHMVEAHGGAMSSRDKKDARRVQTNFEFEEVPGSGRARARAREREPPPQQPRQQPPPPPRPPGPGRRREGFGAALTVEGGGDGSPAGTPRNGVTPPGPSRRNSPSPPPGEVDPAVLECRHTAFIERLQSFAPNPSRGVPVVKAAVRGYRASESSARDLISTIFNVLDCHLEHTASIINSFVDLLDEEERKQDLLTSWKGFEVEQRRQFPDLVPSSVGSGYAGITSGRVLNAKNSTHTRANRSSSRAVWDRVAQAAGSSSSLAAPSPQQRPPDKFPPLRASATTTTPSTSRSSGNQRKTPWVSSTLTPPASTPSPQPQQAIYSVPGPSASSLKNSKPPPQLTKAAFPELPSSTNARQKVPVSGNQSLRNILGINSSVPATNAWGSGGGGGGNNADPGNVGNDNAEAGAADEPTLVVSGGGGGSGGKGKKGKGKQKQTLFTLGSFPT
ncbi:hypothetical protein L218DRAFT_1002324 [Marasmius fiardii PR-910]|nr:hypothetical protein L218DRAFT_1002324 [Marasmius fiardii PR-910]